MRNIRLMRQSDSFEYRCGNTLRFPRAAGEPPRAFALRGLTDAIPPAGVYVYFLRYIVKIYKSFFSTSYLLQWDKFLFNQENKSELLKMSDSSFTFVMLNTLVALYRTQEIGLYFRRFDLPCFVKKAKRSIPRNHDSQYINLPLIVVSL
ncbi:hypothetical protein JOC48_003015 [Aquibacillus albus]|uniref:Uncharacterized protein n=1 Tax=Aquibacillus albus TaxID=1168171 RepID=A0ABS2N2Y9_9BACI|nr:hypothetical protein [Aquibacillus albus]